jgi:hypothetical protein
MPIFEHDDKDTKEEWERQAAQAFDKMLRIEQRKLLDMKEEEFYAD